MSSSLNVRAQLEEVIAKYREQFSKAGIEAQRIQQTLQSKLKQQSELLDRIRQEVCTLDCLTLSSGLIVVSVAVC